MTAFPDTASSGSGPDRFDPTADRFRHVFGHFCTGVTVVTTVDAAGPAGFACQAFAALSLEPPLVLFCPSKTSATWRRVATSGVFCVNVLDAGQVELARVFGTSGADKFAGVGWAPCTSGAPVLDGVLTWAGCEVMQTHDAGDHYIVMGRVTELGECQPGEPLLFYRGRYGAPAARPAEGPPEVVDTILAWPGHADWI